MPRIRCHYTDCVFLEERFCSAASVEFDPDTGCMTFRQSDTIVDDEDWDDELDDAWEEEGYEEEEDEDYWLDDDDEDF